MVLDDPSVRLFTIGRALNADDEQACAQPCSDQASATSTCLNSSGGSLAKLQCESQIPCTAFPIRSRC